jgi:hypothetical protein
MITLDHESSGLEDEAGASRSYRWCDNSFDDALWVSPQGDSRNAGGHSRLWHAAIDKLGKSPQNKTPSSIPIADESK